MKTEIFESYRSFLERPDKTVNGVSADFAAKNQHDEDRGNKGCWNCSVCYDCYGCSGCSDCSGYSYCSEARETLDAPIIPNIHALVLEAVSKTDALDMSNWHICDTTHCRAGWVVVLAGDAGKKLEAKTSTLFAAMQIYKKSSNIRVSPTRFFETNVIAMADIKRCADLESRGVTE